LQPKLILLTLGAVTAVAVPALGFYAYSERPDAAAVEARMDALSGSSAADASAQSGMDKMIAQFQDKVRQNPKDADAWQNLGWAYMHMREPADAAAAYQHAVALAPANVEYRSALAEASIQSGGGKISEATLADLHKITAADPADARARFYLALYKDQQGDHKGAIADWITMLKSAPADAAWAPEVRGVVQQVASEEHLDISGQLPPAAEDHMSPPGPDPAQVAAAAQMSDTDRNSMIHGMVDKLAAELKQNPHDADGWQRLMRARMVLGEKDQAAAAYRGARSAFAKEPAQLATLDSAAHALGVPESQK
jgi:cytochrome c-type biogenesis protein CcmH